MCDSSKGHWQQGGDAGRFRNTLAWSALLLSSSCRTCLGTLHRCRIRKGWTVLLPMYPAQVWCWCKPKQVQGAIKCVSVSMYGKISTFSVFLVKASFVELWLSRKSVPLQLAVLTAQEKFFKFYWIVISFGGEREEWDEEKKETLHQHCNVT